MWPYLNLSWVTLNQGFPNEGNKSNPGGRKIVKAWKGGANFIFGKFQNLTLKLILNIVKLQIKTIKKYLKC